MQTSPHENDRQTGAHRRISVWWKLFAYVALFSTFMLAVVWVFQIGLLRWFYRQSKYDELETVEMTLIRDLRDEGRGFDDYAEDVLTFADEYTVCTRVFRLNWAEGHGYASSLASSPDVSSECFIHPLDEDVLTCLYREAADEGGVYELTLSPGEQLADHLPLDPREQPRPSRRKHIAGGETLLRVRIVPTDKDDEVYMILTNAELVPLNATVQTLKTQFWAIAAILFAGAVVLAILMARNISRPLVQMNEAAKKLAKGSCDADFSVRGYLEVEELSDSLTHAAEELSQNDKLQKELIANISHDLRTPLTMIVGYGEVMRDLPGENTPENVQVIIDETQRLTDLVNDLLDLSKLQSGARKPMPERFDLTETVESVMSRYRKLTEKDGYRIDLSTDGPAVVTADRTMLLQVIYNLINNAVNYTGEDKSVSVVQQLTDGGTRVRVSVTDTGEGIPADRIPYIWDRYYKIDKVHRRAMIGTGLGLSIVKQILENHHATYGVESTPGTGSTFWFELPVVQSADASDGAGG